MTKIHPHILIVIVVFCLIQMTACSLTKNLAETDTVYMGTDINVKDPENGKSIKQFNSYLNNIPQAGTDKGIGNIKVGLYNIYETVPETGFKHWLKYRMGSRTSLYNDNISEVTVAKLEYFLKGKGYFTHTVKCDTTTNKRKTNLQCDITLGERYRIDSLIFPTDTVYQTLKLDDKRQRAVLKENDYYDRDKLEYERIRLATIAGNRGYADFRTNNVYFYLDTAHMNKTLDIYTKIVAPSDSTQHVRYILDSILVYPNSSREIPDSIPTVKTKLKGQLTIIETEPYLDHLLLERLIIEDPEGYFDRTRQSKTNRRLQNLGLFQSVNIVNEPSKNGKQNHLTQKIYLSPTDLQSISGELELSNRSGNILGTGASVTYNHKNLFGHAEDFSLSLGGQVETQFGEDVNFVNSADVNIKAEIAIPRFIAPFIKLDQDKRFLPRTIVRSDYTFQRRTEFYSIGSFTTKFGYRLRQSQSILQEFYPINVNAIKVTGQTQAFIDLLEGDTRLENSFKDVLISGLQYYFTSTKQPRNNSRDYHYFKGELETSGNVSSLLLGADASDPVEVGGLKYSQFAKATVDYRRYWGLGETDIATRIIAGAGLAYGNSVEIPYIKQYFVGGSNSIRAYPIRGLGPGTNYIDPTELTEAEAQFIDQTGDVKLEMNVEYRFPVFKYFKSAIFIDAGNVWLIDNDDNPDGNFDINTFYEQIAIGTGLGLRLDFDFFLIRLDVAFPIRGPQDGGFEWLISDVDFSRDWRDEFLTYQLGIGYPF